MAKWCTIVPINPNYYDAEGHLEESRDLGNEGDMGSNLNIQHFFLKHGL